MTIVVTIAHVLVALTLILIVLLQTGKGADIGAAFGGASQTFFGGRGAATFLAKVTAGAAALFMLTSLYLARVSASRTGESVFDAAPAATAPAAPAAPAEPASPAAPAAPAEPAAPAATDPAARPQR